MNLDVVIWQQTNWLPRYNKTGRKWSFNSDSLILEKDLYLWNINWNSYGNVCVHFILFSMCWYNYWDTTWWSGSVWEINYKINVRLFSIFFFSSHTLFAILAGIHALYCLQFNSFAFKYFIWVVTSYVIWMKCLIVNLSKQMSNQIKCIYLIFDTYWKNK